MADIIMKVVDWLNTNSGAIIAIGTVAVAGATVVLVGVTIFYAWVTRQMRLDAQKPRIAIYLGCEKEQMAAEYEQQVAVEY